jgi:hypothetical protein
MNRIRIPLALSLITLALLAAPSLRAADEPQIRQSGSVSYVSGGVGDEEFDRILSLGRDFNLKLLFATRSGAYLSDVNITLMDTRGQRLLDAKTDGPLFYAKLPAGRYQIEASSNGTTLRKSVAVTAQGQRKVDLRWND